MRDFFLQRSGTSVEMCWSTNQWKQICWFSASMSVFHLNETRWINTNHFGKYPRYMVYFFFTSPSLFRTLPETFIHERLWFPWPPRDQAFVLADGELISRFAKGLHLLTLHPHKISTSSAAVYQPVCYKWDVMRTYIIHYMFLRVLCIHKVGICICPLFWQNTFHRFIGNLAMVCEKNTFVCYYQHNQPPITTKIWFKKQKHKLQ